MKEWFKEQRVIGIEVRADGMPAPYNGQQWLVGALPSKSFYVMSDRGLTPTSMTSCASSLRPPWKNGLRMAWTNASQSRSLDFETEGGPRRANKSRVHGASTAQPRRVPAARYLRAGTWRTAVWGPRFFVNCVLYKRCEDNRVLRNCPSIH